MNIYHKYYPKLDNEAQGKQKMILFMLKRTARFERNNDKNF